MFDPHRTMVTNTFEPEQNELLAAIVDSSQDPIVSQDLDGVITAWNKAAQMLLGYTAAEAIGQPITLVALDLTQVDFAAFFERLQSAERVDEVESRFRGKDGAVISASLNVALLRARSGKLLGTAIALRQLLPNRGFHHELVLLNAELLQSERRFRILSETLADLLWSIGVETAVPCYFSPKFAEYAGLATGSLTKGVWLDLLHPEDVPAARETWLEAQESEQAFQVEFRLRRADGAYRWFVGRGTPVRNDQGEIVQWLGTCTDIDGIKRGEEALRRSNRELKQFAYAAAHDLQEPLRNVATSIGMLRRQYESKLDPSGMEWIDASMEGAHRMYAMVKDLLTFSTIIEEEAGLPDDASVSCRTALETALIELSSEVEQAAPDIRIGPLPRLAIKRTHAVRLFQNIIGNSVKYRRSDVRLSIEISAQLSGTDWTISVRDNGIGFDPVYANKIFGVFTRLHTRDTYPGNGIGLAVCERIVAHYGGRIWAEAAVETGATFYFTLPGVTADQ